MQHSQVRDSLIDNLSLRTKVIVLLLAISLGPLLITGVVSINRAVDHGKRSEREHFARTALLTAGAFEGLFGRVQKDLERMSRRFPAERFDLPRLSADVQRTGRLLPSLPEWRDAPFLSNQGDEVSHFFLAAADGTVVYTFPFRNLTAPVNIAEQPWFDPPPPQKTFASDPLTVLTGSRRPSLIVSVPLNERNGKTAGYLGAVIDGDRLQEVVLRMFQGHEAVTKSGSVLLMDPDGFIVAHSDRRLVGENAPEFRKQLRSPGTSEINAEGMPLLVSRSEVGRIGWFVQVSAPIDEVYRFVYVLIRILAVVTLLTIVLVLLIADYFASVLLRPVVDLQRGAEMMGTGAFEYRIDLADHRNDELGQLAQAFNQMAENLQNSRKELGAYSRSLETAHEELDAMVYAITHDLKKSLRGIEAYASFLREDFAETLGADGGSMLSSISTNVDRINQLADDLVGLIRAERDRSESTTFSAHELVEEVRQHALARCPGEVLLSGALPDITGDRARIALIFQHLIDNGLKFNRHPVPCVEVRAEEDAYYWQFDVTDNGIGIDPQYAEQIFELFFRLNQKEEFPGNGTGLNIARRIAYDHRGRIEFNPSPEGGSRFTLFLPKDGSRLTTPGFSIS